MRWIAPIYNVTRMPNDQFEALVAKKAVMLTRQQVELGVPPNLRAGLDLDASETFTLGTDDSLVAD